MLVQLCLMAVFYTGSVVACSRFDKKFEDVLPLTLSGIVLVLFAMGLLGALAQGVVLVLGICVLLYGYAGYTLCQTKQIMPFCKKFFTPCFFVFSGAMLLLTYCNSGKMASSWDEFSHWVDVVKMMTISGVLSTSPLSHSLFQSYPPGMALFQYFVQKVYLLAHPAEVFNEWRVFFAFQIFALSFFFPLFRQFSYKRPLSIALSLCACVVACMLFFDELWVIVYIDVFLALLTGIGFATVYIVKEKDLCCYANLLACISMLVLAKDAGLLFAAFLVIAVVLDGVGCGTFAFAKNVWQKCAAALGALLAVALPKLLWGYSIQASGAEVRFSAPVEWNTLLCVLLGQDTSYRAESFLAFRQAIVTRGMGIPRFANFTITYANLLWVFALVCVVISICYHRHNGSRYTRLAIAPVLLLLQTICFVLGSCISYLFKFNPIEAVTLASFDRYMKAAYLPLLLVVVLGLIHLLWAVKGWQKYIYFVVLLVFAVVCVYIAAIIPFITRSQILASMDIRVPYQPLAQQLAACQKEPDCDIYFVSQNDSGLDGLVVRFLARPFGMFEMANLNDPSTQGSAADTPPNAAAVQTILQAQYEYVAIYTINDYFLANYSSLFANPSEITSASLYQVDAQTGLLTRCVG